MQVQIKHPLVKEESESIRNHTDLNHKNQRDIEVKEDNRKTPNEGGLTFQQLA